MSRRWAALAAVSLTTACSVLPTVQPRVFTTGFKAGETIRYTVHTTVAGSLTLGSQQVPLNSDRTLTETLKVKAVDHAGVATLEVTSEDPVQAATGAAPASPPATLQVGRDGRIRSGGAAALGGPIPAIPGSDQLTPVLASKPVSPGDRWDLDYQRPNPYGDGTFKFASHNRYLRREAVSGRQAAVFETRLQGPLDFTIDFSRLPAPTTPTNPPTVTPTGPIHYTGTVSSTMTYWVDLESLQVLKESGGGAYLLDYGLAEPGVSGPQQVTFNGTVTTDLERA